MDAPPADWPPELAEWSAAPLAQILGDCAPLHATCAAADRVERHGLDGLAARWRAFCPDAGECDRLAAAHASLARSLDETPQASFVPDRADVSPDAVSQAPVEAQWYRALPETDPVRLLLEDAVRTRCALLAVQCRHSRQLPALLAATGLEMLDGHAGAGRWLASELPRLAASPGLAVDRMAPQFPAYQALLAAGDRYRFETPDVDKWKQVRKALGAWRRGVPPWESTFVLVQVPQAYIELYVDSRMILRFNAVVGSPKKEKDPDFGSREFLYRTLPLNSAITGIVVNPEWRIPSSIVTREIEPRLATDPDYLERRNIRLEQFPSGAVRYVQEAGDRNAMGRIKFRFPNRYGYFLHDSPDKKLFRKSYRLHSHGCIRIDRASKLAERLLARDKGWNFDQLRKTLRRGETREVTLTTPVPIHILYSTVAADNEGRLFFSRDWYELEE